MGTLQVFSRNVLQNLMALNVFWKFVDFTNAFRNPIVSPQRFHQSLFEQILGDLCFYSNRGKTQEHHEKWIEISSSNMGFYVFVQFLFHLFFLRNPQFLFLNLLFLLFLFRQKCFIIHFSFTFQSFSFQSLSLYHSFLIKSLYSFKM